MKKSISFLLCAFGLTVLLAQNPDGQGREIPRPTTKIQTLLAKEQTLKTSGDIEGLEANRQALKIAWEKIDPLLASEYRTIVPTEAIVEYIPSPIQARPLLQQSNNLLLGDNLLNKHYNDGVDIDTALDGTIYVAAYENKLRYGTGNDAIRIYKSTDNGVSFVEWFRNDTAEDIIKMKMTFLDKPATKYLFITYATLEGNLQNLQINLAGGSTVQTITNGVKDFDIDADYEFNSGAALYAVYIKNDNMIYSARSGFNSDGMQWRDEHPFGYSAKECALAYGKEGTFVLFTGYNTGHLYFASNPSFNNPSSWNKAFVISDDSDIEFSGLNLKSERKPNDQYRAVALAAYRPKDSQDDFHVWINIVENDKVVNQSILAVNGIRYLDSWSRRSDNNDVIHTSAMLTSPPMQYLFDIRNGEGEELKELTSYHPTAGTALSAIAGDGNNNAISVYIGQGNSNLYFDKNIALGQR